MSQISEINEQILTKILKTDEFYEALWGKEDFTPNPIITEPNDFNCGAIANSLEYLYGFVKEITGQVLEDLPSPYLDIVVYFFTGLKRFSGETNVELLNRMNSLTVREGDFISDQRGTPWDIMNVLGYYIEKSLMFYVPNHVLTNLIVNGTFESEIGSEWTTTGDRSIAESFSGSWKMDLSSSGPLSQTISLTEGSYILNCFIKPISDPTEITEITEITIQRSSDSYYFNTSDLVWQLTDPLNRYSTSESGYNLCERFIIIDGGYDVTVTFTKIEDCLLDHVEVGQKLYPAFEIIYTDEGFAEDFASVWVDGVETFENASFVDQDYMFSSATTRYSDAYTQSVLDKIKASGIKGVYNREVKS